MAERQDDLRDSLRELRSAISTADLGEAAARERLTALVAGIEAKLEREEDDEDEHETLLDHARELIGQLETEHPRATSILNRIMMSLGGAGI